MLCNIMLPIVTYTKEATCGCRNCGFNENCLHLILVGRGVAFVQDYCSVSEAIRLTLTPVLMSCLKC